jgi:6 kDa early secretory antigenic target
MNGAMAGSFRVTPEQLDALAARLVAGAGEIDEIDSALRAAVAPVRGEWEGEASARFDALWEQWAASARMLQEALDGVSRLLASSASNYSTTDGGIAAGLGGGA